MVDGTNEQLNFILDNCLNLYDEPNSDFSELDHSLFDHVVDSIERDEEGRLIAPALWDADVEHLLAKNFKLARSILMSTINKLRNIARHWLNMMRLYRSN